MNEITKIRLKRKGQITIPSAIRNRLHLKTGEKLIVIANKNEITIRPEIENPLEKAGMFGKDNETTTVKDLIAKYKGF
ncbi:MAG: AbrB/MazE/SpoVT family DNA-binding domain-containing protein [archaeon]